MHSQKGQLGLAWNARARSYRRTAGLSTVRESLTTNAAGVFFLTCKLALGLWPDNCDGSYESYCDLSRQYDPVPSPAVLPDGTRVPAWNGTTIDTWIKEFGRYDLLDYSAFGHLSLLAPTLKSGLVYSGKVLDQPGCSEYRFLGT
jgi:hypothetical protein